MKNPRPQSKIISYLLWLPALMLIILPSFFWNGGLLDDEATTFIRQYLDNRSIVQKVFDPYANDQGTYQARELSYFIDHIDAQCFQALMKRGVVFFVPASALLSSLLTLIIFHFGTRKLMPELNPVTSGLILLLYFSNFVYAATMGMFYRSAKPFLIPVLLATMFYVSYYGVSPDIEKSKQGARVFSRHFLCAFLLCCLMSLLDRQGFFYAVVLCVCLSFYYLLRKKCRPLLMGSLSAVCLMVFYDLILAPAIIQSVNGYRPNLDYQKISVGKLVSQPKHLSHAVTILAQNTALLFGSLPVWIWLSVVIAALIWKVWPRLMSGQLKETITRFRVIFLWNNPPNLGVIFGALILAANIVMFALMIIRHPPLYESKDHWLFYYPLPFLIILLFGLLIVLRKSLPSLSRRRIVILHVLLIAMVLSNVLSWPGLRNTMLSSQWFPYVYLQTTSLKTSLREGRAQESLRHGYRKFYDYCVERFSLLKMDAESGSENSGSDALK